LKNKNDYYVIARNMPVDTVNPSQQQLEAFERFISALKEIDNEPLTDEDFAELENNRVNFTLETKAIRGFSC